MVDGPKLLVGTRKGVWFLSADEKRQEWSASEPMFLGHIARTTVASAIIPDRGLIGSRDRCSARAIQSLSRLRNRDL